MRRSCVLAVVCSGVLLASASSADERAWLELSSPNPEYRASGAVPLVEIRGRAGAGLRRQHDVVVAIDLSESALYPSGFDANGDGVVGELVSGRLRRSSGGLRSHRRWTTDPGDTIARAEIEVARRLIRRLRKDGARVGLVTFSGRPRTRARVGDPGEALRALEHVRVRLDSSGTNLRAVTHTALRALERVAHPAEGRERLLFILSDGYPTVPYPEIHARRAALAAAKRAARAGVRIHALAFGGSVEPDTSFRQMARLTGGEFVRVTHLAQVPEIAPRLGLEKLGRVTIKNRTSGTSGRAIRLFADGSFDGYVSLVEGANRIEITARTVQGAEARLARTVHYEGPPAQAGDLAALQDRLRARTVETELAAQAGRGHRLERLLVIETER